MKKLKKLLLTAAVGGLIGLTACGGQAPKPVNPTLEQTVTQQYPGGQFQGDKTFVEIRENLDGATCELEVDGNDFSTIKPEQQISLNYGTDLNAGTHTFTTTCIVNGKTVTDTDTITFEDAAVTHTIPQKNSQGVNLKPTWDGEKGTFTVTLDTNVDPNRITGYKIVLTPTDAMVNLVNAVLNEDPTNDFYRTLPTHLDSQTANVSSATFNWYYPGGNADVYVKLTTEDGKTLENTTTEAFIAKGVVKALFPSNFSDSYGSFDGVTYIDTDGSPRDVDGSSTFEWRTPSFYGTKNPSQAYQKAAMFDSEGNVLDTFEQTAEYTSTSVPNLAAWMNFVRVDASSTNAGKTERTFYPTQTDANNGVNGTEKTIIYRISPAPGP